MPNMTFRPVRICACVLVVLSISAGPLMTSFAPRGLRSLLAVAAEGSADSINAEAELLPLFVDAPHAPRWLVEHCHEVCPETVEAPAERLLADDRAARGSPIG